MMLPVPPAAVTGGQNRHVAAVRRCLAQIDAAPHAAAVALLARRDAGALAEAGARDALDALARHAAPLAGCTLAVKACFDSVGWVTHAGSQVLATRPPADQDADMVAALRRAGAIVLAQTNMTEFAYGALGLNPWHGTPLSPLFPAGEPRVAGGSSSGAAAAVALGMADVSLCSDTSGSARIPAAFCGVAGFKPTRGRYPVGGMLFLSPSFDTPGIIAGSAQTCLRVDAALVPVADHLAMPRLVPDCAPLEGLRLLLPEATIGRDLDAAVGQQLQSWMARLEALGARIVPVRMQSLEAAAAVAREGGIIAAEAFMLHQETLRTALHRYDPRVGPRMLAGAGVAAHCYALAQQRLRELAQQYRRELGDAHAVLTPAVPMLPPLLASLQNDETYARENLRAFRLTEFASRLDQPSITLPGDLRERASIGMMLTGAHGADRRLLRIATRVEGALTAQT